MEISALAQALTSQSAMGMLLVKVMDQAQQMIQQQAAYTVQQAMVTPVALDGVGENLDVTA